MLLAVSYHYVVERPRDEPLAIFPVTTAALAAQIELLGQSFTFVARDDLLDAVARRRNLPDRACVLTFDDGLRCQVELALPVLEKLGVPAIFFVPGAPLAEKRVLSVHKLHALRERLATDEFQARLDVALTEAGIESPRVTAEEAQRHYRYDEPGAARTKDLLNMALPPQVRNDVVGSLFAAEFDERTYAEQLYADRGQIAELEREYRSVGAHSYAHEPLAGLPDDELRADLERVRELVREVTGSPPLALSYPYGTPATVDARVVAAAEGAGFAVGFTMERRTNETLDEPLLLARLDTNDAPGGAKPEPELLKPTAPR